MIKLKPLVISLIIPLGTGGLAGFFTMNSMEVYKNLNQPNLAPPSFVFPIVWTILYILMGISSYLIYQSDSSTKSKSLILYSIQLIFNFIWPIIFFNGGIYLFSLVWLVILWVLVLLMIISFYKINKTAAYLQIPYLLWLTFAAYLNLSIYILN